MKNVIYKIRNVVNDSYYVGSTVDSRKRFWAHRKALRAGTHVCVHLQRAWNKYGEDCFKFEIVAQVENKAALFPAEQRWLDDNFGRSYCYNTAAHADAPMRDASPEMRAHLAAKTKAWAMANGHPRTGAVWSAEQREGLRQARIGKHAGENHYRYGKTVSDEVKAKISAAQKGVPKAPRTFTPEGLEKARENMKRNAKEQAPVAFAAVHAKFPTDVQTRYDFTAAQYTGALVRIEGVVCPNHGSFSQYAAQFRKGRGCPQCGAEQRAESKRKQMLDFWGTPEGREQFIASRAKGVDTP